MSKMDEPDFEPSFAKAKHSTGIEWTHRPGTKGETWNPIVGCSITSPGCTNCYAMDFAGMRLDREGGPAHYRGTTKVVNGRRVWSGKVEFANHKLLEPLRWTKPRTVFVNSMGDVFHEDVPDDWIDRVFAVMALSSQHTFILLTKRSKRMRAYVTRDNSDTYVRTFEAHWRGPDSEWCQDGPRLRYLHPRAFPNWPLSNVWLGVSAERQQEADERIPDLLETPAAVRLVSAEPLLGPIELRPYWLQKETFASTWLDWIIAGGESGSGARPMRPDWVRSIRDQCATASVPFFFKQWGNHAPQGPRSDKMVACSKASAGSTLDGREHKEWPGVAA